MRIKTEAKRQAFIDAAALLFAEKGYPSVSMSDIAERAQSSKATLYNYFDAKELVFIEVIRAQAGESFAAAFNALDRGLLPDVRGRLLEFGLLFCRALLQPQVLEAVRLAQHEGSRSTLGRLFYEGGQRRCWAQVGDHMSLAMQEGHLLAADPLACALHFKALCQSEWFEPCMWGVLSPSEVDLEALVPRAVDVFLRAYAPKIEA